MLFASVVLGTIGQILMKTGMNQAPGRAAEVGVAAIMTALKSVISPWVFAGFVCYGISSILWLMILKKVSLSTAYPMISMSYVFVVFLSAIFLHEKPNWATTMPGLIFIMVGVSLIGIGSGK